MAKWAITEPEMILIVPDGLTAEQCIGLWVDLLDAYETFIRARLRREVGPEGDVEAAYRRWYARRMEEHDRALIQMAENYSRCIQHARLLESSDDPTNTLPS
jgi:hypothetical protein